LLRFARIISIGISIMSGRLTRANSGWSSTGRKRLELT
jgi:hypothetical protein